MRYQLQTSLLLATCCITGLAYGDGCCVQGTCVTATSAECAAMGGTHYAWECPANGYCPEATPRDGEQRLNRFQYIGSHNSFQRGSLGDVTLTEQLDDWGMRHLELDLWYHQPTDTYEIQHNCCDTIGEGTLEESLIDLASSWAIEDGFFFVSFQVHEIANTWECDFCFDDMPANWRDEVRAEILSHIDAESVYTPGEFDKIDGKKWPSVQELRRRGRHIVIVGEFGASHEDDYFFFDHVYSCTTGGNDNDVEIRSGTPVGCQSLGDDKYSLWYPSLNTCPLESDTDWLSAVNLGMTFATTYCYDDVNRITYPELHPPLPMYVNTFSNEAEYLGTWGRPYPGATGLGSALQRLSLHQVSKGQSNVEISIGAGTYVLTDAVTGALSMRCTLTARNGIVTLE